MPPLIKSTLFSGSIHELLHPPKTQIPFLDGLRSIAVLLVIDMHLSGKFAAANGPNFYSGLPWVKAGSVGVDLFFVLSGFFIGGQLWKELKSRGSVDVGRFVMRRGFRIWPLYFFIFLCVLILGSIFASYVPGKQYGWTDLIFITNYYNRGIVMGSWSLCTEEQFYIVTPLVLFFLGRHVGLIRNWRLWLWGLLLSVPLLRAVIWVYLSGSFFKHDPELFKPLYYFSVTHCDGLIIGLIIANLWVTREKPAYRFATPGILVLLAFVLGFALHQLQREIFSFTSYALTGGSLVWLGIQRSPAIFNSRVFYWISRLSYGMYLNHEYMCPWIVNLVLPKLHLTARFPVLANLIGVVLITMLSAAISLLTFCFVEHPFLQMRTAVLGSHANRSVHQEPPLRESEVQESI